MARLRPISLPIAIVLAAAAAAGQAGEFEDGNLKLFVKYCAACHGEDGTGGGTVAAESAKPPPDLTHLTRDNGGRFPLGLVTRAIDGRDVRRARGSDMPAWGKVFAADPFVNDRFGVRIRVRRLVEHVRSIQEPGG